MSPEAISLKDYFNHRLDNLREFLEARLWDYVKAHDNIHTLLQKSLDETAKQLATRLEGMNEFRDQLKDQAQLFVTRDMLDGFRNTFRAEMVGMEDKLNTRIDSANIRLVGLEKFQTTIESRIVAVGVAFTILNILIVAIGLAITYLVPK